MKKLYTLINSEINKEYDLCITTYSELKELILKDSGLTEREMQLKFDSLSYKDLEQFRISREDMDIILDDVERERKRIYVGGISYKYNNMLKRLKLVKMWRKGSARIFDTENLVPIEGREGWFKWRNGFNLEEKAEKERFIKYDEIINGIEKELEGINNLEEYTEKYFNYPDNDKYLNYDMYIDNNEMISLPELVSYSTLLQSKSSLFFISDKYKEIDEKQKTIKNDISLKSDYFNVRVDKAVLGIEAYPFVIEEYNEKIILLDGFNRLFGNDFKELDKEIIVKKYNNLSEQEYMTVLYEINDWKIKLGNDYLFLDRGVKASAFIKYGTNLTTASLGKENVIQESIALEKRQKEYKTKKEDKEFVLKSLQKGNFDNIIFGFLADNFYTKETPNHSQLMDYMYSSDFKQHLTKMNNYKRETFVKKYLNNNVSIFENDLGIKL